MAVRIVRVCEADGGHRADGPEAGAGLYVPWLGVAETKVSPAGSRSDLTLVTTFVACSGRCWSA